MFRKLLTTCILLLASVSSAAVQQASAQAVVLDSLTLIRVEQTSRPKWLTGRLLAADSQVLTLRSRDRPHVVPLSAVERVDVSVGYIGPKVRMRSGARRGFVLGAAVSGALLVLGVAADLTTECEDCMLPASVWALGYSVSITASTTAAGAFFGALSSGERWRRVSLPVEVRSSRSSPAREH